MNFLQPKIKLRSHIVVIRDYEQERGLGKKQKMGCGVFV